jgi:hypothetical protein
MLIGGCRGAAGFEALEVAYRFPERLPGRGVMLFISIYPYPDNLSNTRDSGISGGNGGATALENQVH